MRQHQAGHQHGDLREPVDLAFAVQCASDNASAARASSAAK